MTFAFNCYLSRAIAMAVRDGESALPSLVMDIKGGVPHTTYRDVWFPALRHEDLGRLLCSARGRTILHGHLAYIVDKDLGLDTLLECGDRSRLALGGAEPGSHYLGMTRPFWRQLGWIPGCWIGSFGLTDEALPLLPREGLPLADGSTYLPRRPSGAPPVRITWNVNAAAKNAVLLTNMLGRYEYFRIVAAEADGQAVAPAAENDLSSLFKPPNVGSPTVTWRFTIETTNARAIDVVSLAGSGRLRCDRSSWPAKDP